MTTKMLDYVKGRLGEVHGADLEAAATASKVYSSWTLLKIRQGKIPNPGVIGIENLFHYFKAQEVKRRRAA
jgi:hypothetical protein